MTQSNIYRRAAYREITSAESALQALAQSVIDHERDQLPNLSHVTIILENPCAFTQVRRILLEAVQPLGFTALLGPHVHTLHSWAAEHAALTHPIMSGHTQELLLVEALQNHPDLYGKASPWSLASSLLDLFSELSHAAIPLPDSLESFQTQIERAYGKQPTAFAALSREASLVYRLWQAMANQVSALDLTDNHVAYISGLSTALKAHTPGKSLYILPPLSPDQAEQESLQKLVTQPNVHILPFTSGQVSGQRTVPFMEFIRVALEEKTPALVSRAPQFSQHYPDSPLLNQLSVFLAEGAEQEAEAVELQTRRWLLDGKKNIGIITEDRRLARRIRALLERANVLPADAGGWALSTTSAATAIERWMQCLEEDFHYQAFLDLLKSPFLFPDQDRPNLLATVYRFEQGIVRGENIANNLRRYTHAVASRCQRLSIDQRAYYDAIVPLLEQIDAAAQPLLGLINAQLNRPSEFLDALVKSITLLGLDKSFARDDAGQCILELIGGLASASQHTQLQMDWPGFRTWLGRALEVSTFHPPVIQQSVQILSLRQSHLLNFDAVIVAAMEQDSFPAVHNTSPFFNDGVRASLGLRTRDQRQQEAYIYFHRLLGNSAHQNAPCLLTARRIDNGEDIQASSWLQGLQVFHLLAYGHDLIDDTLPQLLGRIESKVRADDQSVPAVTTRPRPSLNPALLPRSLSASAYQALMDCPYQFYAGRCLQLIPSEEVRTALSKSDYGERVHLCLQAFHSPIAHLPGPFAEPVTDLNRGQAETLMMTIADKVFSEDIADNFMHRSWLLQWKSCIPAYLRWQIDRSKEWTFQQSELNASSTLLNDIHINGRLDRVDRQPSALAVVDYKTGSTATLKDIEDGESVQLPFYALLAGDAAVNTVVKRVEYLCFDKHAAASKAVLEDDGLADLSKVIGERLVDVILALRDGADAPAWGDELSCSRCVMEGVCRRQCWQ